MNLSAGKISYFSCFAYLPESVYFEINVVLSCYSDDIKSRHLCVWIRIQCQRIHCASCAAALQLLLVEVQQRRFNSGCF